MPGPYAQKPPLSKGGAERSEAEGFLGVRRRDGQPGKARRNPSVRLRRPPPFDKGGFFLLAHFFIFFALLEYFSIILHKLVAFPVPIIL